MPLTPFNPFLSSTDLSANSLMVSCAAGWMWAVHMKSACAGWLCLCAASFRLAARQARQATHKVVGQVGVQVGHFLQGLCNTAALSSKSSSEYSTVSDTVEKAR